MVECDFVVKVVSSIFKPLGATEAVIHHSGLDVDVDYIGLPGHFFEWWRFSFVEAPSKK
jgi:hypothetical protein